MRQNETCMNHLLSKPQISSNIEGDQENFPICSDKTILVANNDFRLVDRWNFR